MNAPSVALVIPASDVSCKMKNQVARYECKATLTAQAITSNQVISTLLVHATASTSVYSALYAIKLKKLIYYTPAVVSSATSAMDFEWQTPNGSLFGTEPSSIVVGSVGTAMGGRRVFVPPKDSPWSKWITINSPGNVTMFTHSVPAGTTVDIVYDAYVENGDVVIQYATVTGLTVGHMYRMGFDGNPAVTSNWLPIGFAVA